MRSISPSVRAAPRIGAINLRALAFTSSVSSGFSGVPGSVTDKEAHRLAVPLGHLDEPAAGSLEHSAT